MGKVNRSSNLFRLIIEIISISNKKLKLLLSLSFLLAIISSVFEFLFFFLFYIFCNTLIDANLDTLELPFLRYFEFYSNNKIIYSSTLLILITILGVFFKLSNLIIQRKISASFTIYFSKRFFENQVFANFLNFKNKNLGYLSSIENKSLVAISELISGLLNGITGFTNVLLIVCSIIILSGGKILLILLTLVIFYITILKLTRIRLLNNSQIIERSMIKQVNNLNFLLNDFKFINLTGFQKNLIEEYNSTEKVIRSLYAKNSILGLYPKYIIEAIAIICISLLSILLSQKTNEVSQILPILGIIGIGSLRLLPSLQAIYTSWADSTGHVAPAETIISEIKNSNKVVRKKTFTFNRLGIKKSLKIENISFKYPKAKRNIINNLSFEIKKGDYIGIVGKSGTGKTTLLDIITGFLEFQNGYLKIDNKTISHNSLDMIHWQRSIAIVSQEIYIREGNFLNNLVFDKENYDLEKLDNACKTAEIYDYIQKQKYGYFSEIPARGSNLSGGQRQRIALARAIYYNPSLLILDEFTSAIDSYTEKKILNNIKKIKNNKTIIVISHRKETLNDCDYILNLDSISE